MTSLLVVVLLAVLWATAAVFWLLDAPSPRATVEILLDGRVPAEETLAA